MHVKISLHYLERIFFTDRTEFHRRNLTREHSPKAISSVAGDIKLIFSQESKQKLKTFPSFEK